jgi:coenzyme F420-0:L-glutamate ligase / coenzyme F420-1:gamma-L-glutamate ligase
MSKTLPSSTTSETAELRVIGLAGVPEVKPGDDLPALIAQAIETSGVELEEGDILVVTHKIVSKSEGRLVHLPEIDPSALAQKIATQFGKDARQVEVVLRESARIVRMDRGVIISETAHGFICANAGVDASNVAPETVCLLPVDPDASAFAIREALGQRFGVTPGIIISDSFGRAWRWGIVNVAIGVAGVAPLADYRGYYDSAGYELHVSVLAVADELAAAAELVMNKLDARPVVLIRGFIPPTETPSGTGKDLILDPARDLFR